MLIQRIDEFDILHDLGTEQVPIPNDGLGGNIVDRHIHVARNIIVLSKDAYMDIIPGTSGVDDGYIFRA